MIHILLCEDDTGIQRNLKVLLEREGWQVTALATQRDTLAAFLGAGFDLALLDLSLPDGSGYAVCAAIKRACNMPVIFLTASDDEINIVTGFDVGADDYITKPFRPLELISRIKNVLRRCGKTQSVFELHGLTVDTVRATVSRAGQDIPLSAMEYRLLLTFLNNRGAVLSREQLLGKLWDVVGGYVNDNTLTVYIKRLRGKIEADPQNPIIIRTVRGLGYRMDG